MILDLVRRDRGEEDAILLAEYRFSGSDVFVTTARDLLDHTPAMFGKCAPMSAMWAALIRDRYDVPAVAVVGDLLVEGSTIFSCNGNIPHPETMTESQCAAWEGHCWIEIAGMIGDISILRTARMIDRPSVLKAFLDRHIGLQRGMMMMDRTRLEAIGMNYVAKHVLSDSQMNSLIGGMRDEIQRLLERAPT